ncbi:hypothetical protein KIL84_009721 [Mauremys mutica]|uniref:Uncharacterized protein n=1 Tax=Mauremys mutica TaxID=74926 RepID=A0A9D3XLQ8_9SAUR|nr:hypothetical protein KIL84_009721 [Mauremys mutica]
MQRPTLVHAAAKQPRSVGRERDVAGGGFCDGLGMGPPALCGRGEGVPGGCPSWRCRALGGCLTLTETHTVGLPNATFVNRQRQRFRSNQGERCLLESGLTPPAPGRANDHAQDKPGPGQLARPSVTPSPAQCPLFLSMGGGEREGVGSVPVRPGRWCEITRQQDLVLNNATGPVGKSPKGAVSHGCRA